jgi:hypothetical protein
VRKPACCRCHPTRTAAAIRVQVDGDDLFRRGKDRSGCSRETAAATNTDRRVSLRSRPIMAKGALLPRCADHVGWALRAPNKADLTVLEFNSFGAHIGSGYGGADMPLTGPIPEGRTFFCPSPFRPRKTANCAWSMPDGAGRLDGGAPWGKVRSRTTGLMRNGRGTFRPKL